MTDAALGSTATVSPGLLPGTVSAMRLSATVRRLAGDEFTGRRVGTVGGRAAGAFLAEELRNVGAQVTVEEFRVGYLRDVYATPTFVWTDEAGQVRVLEHRRDFAEHLTSADLPAPRDGALVTAGAADWAVRWVLADGLDPPTTARAVEQGAAGLLVPRGTDAAGWMPKMLAGRPAVAVPVVSLRTDLHQTMTASLGQVTASVPLAVLAATGTNIHGQLTRAAPGGVSVVLTAHYDGVGDDPGRRLPAAADNASGCAVILEAARFLVPDLPVGVGLAVAFLDAEETGAQGSAHHAPTLAAGTFVINVDGAAELADAAAVEAGGPANALLAALDHAGREVGVPLRAAAMPSDNRRYAAAGLPSVGIGMGMPGYQTPAETVDRVQPETLTAATDLVTTTVRRLFAPR